METELTGGRNREIVSLRIEGGRREGRRMKREWGGGRGGED